MFHWQCNAGVAEPTVTNEEEAACSFAFIMFTQSVSFDAGYIYLTLHTAVCTVWIVHTATMSCVSSPLFALPRLQTAHAQYHFGNNIIQDECSTQAQISQNHIQNFIELHPKFLKSQMGPLVSSQNKTPHWSPKNPKLNPQIVPCPWLVMMMMMMIIMWMSVTFIMRSACRCFNVYSSQALMRSHPSDWLLTKQWSGWGGWGTRIQHFADDGVDSESMIPRLWWEVTCLPLFCLLNTHLQIYTTSQLTDPGSLWVR